MNDLESNILIVDDTVSNTTYLENINNNLNVLIFLVGLFFIYTFIRNMIRK